MDQVILFVQQLLNGLSLGSIYALIALGYTMVYGVLRFINFAHGDVYMLGAFAGYFLAPVVAHFIPLTDMDSFTVQNTVPILANAGLVLIGSMLVCAVAGVIIERLPYPPVRNRPRLNVLIYAVGGLPFLSD